MNTQTHDVLVECTEGSSNERITFPEVVGKLIAAGVERYTADLTRAEKTYYLPNGENETLKMYAVSQTPAERFSADGVEAAVRASQQQKIKYRGFCERIAQAGCVGYMVSLAGKRAVYYGRTGETHVEMFPQ
ncbi:MAG TPA: DUF1398 family protein [Rhizomicrobium sp.]|nr:DUF1398 family protein [Rhizomicrobium sp.]